MPDVGRLDPHAASPRQRGWLEIDADRFAREFDRSPFLVGHRLSSHPLLDLPQLVELARTLPPASVEYNAGDLPLSADPRLTPHTGLTAEETIRRIEDSHSWMALKNVEQVPAYRTLLTECLAQIAEHSEGRRPGMYREEGFVFVSSARAVTPFHMDPEHNFLLQVRGAKTVTVFDGRDRSMVSDAQLEECYSGRYHRNLPFTHEWRDKGRAFDLRPGVGVHIPVTFPHHVQVGDEHSVSFSITFRTPDLDRRGLVHRVNRRLRAMGVTPKPPGESPFADAVKGALAWSLDRLRGQDSRV